MLLPCRVQAVAGGQNVIGSLLTLTVSWLVLCLSVYPVLENRGAGTIEEVFGSFWEVARQLLTAFGVQFFDIL